MNMITIILLALVKKKNSMIVYLNYVNNCDCAFLQNETNRLTNALTICQQVLNDIFKHR